VRHRRPGPRALQRPGDGDVRRQRRGDLDRLRTQAIETWNGQFKASFDGGVRVPTRGLVATRRFVLGAVFVYQLVLLHRLALGADLRTGLKPCLRAA
jgi:hypothetical protein